MKKELDLVGLCRSTLTSENELTKGKIYAVHLLEKVADKIKRIGIINDKNEYGEYDTKNLSIYYKVSDEEVEKLKRIKNKNDFNIGDVVSIKDKYINGKAVIMAMYGDFLFLFKVDDVEILFDKGCLPIKKNEVEKTGVNLNKSYIKQCIDKYDKSVSPNTLIDNLKDFCSKKITDITEYIYHIKRFPLDKSMMLCVGITNSLFYISSPEIFEKFKPIILAGLTYDVKTIEDSVELCMEDDELELDRNRLVLGTLAFVIMISLRAGNLNKIFEF